METEKGDGSSINDTSYSHFQLRPVMRKLQPVTALGSACWCGVNVAVAMHDGVHDGGGAYVSLSVLRLYTTRARTPYWLLY